MEGVKGQKESTVTPGVPHSRACGCAAGGRATGSLSRAHNVVTEPGDHHPRRRTLYGIQPPRNCAASFTRGVGTHPTQPRLWAFDVFLFVPHQIQFRRRNLPRSRLPAGAAPRACVCVCVCVLERCACVLTNSESLLVAHSARVFLFFSFYAQVR